MTTRSQIRACAIALGVLTNVATAQVLWKESAALTVSDWVSGPGGAAAAPRVPFKFVKENLGGTSPKIDVTDAAGRTWVVKFGSEVHADTFAARFLYAVGYASAPTFFVLNGVIQSVHDVKHAKPFLMKDGSFHNARFKLHQHHERQWSWVDNPFTGSRELGGLKIMIMLLSNWDTKDARDGEGSNNAVFEESHSGRSSTPWFAVTDWGASFGKSGGFFQRDRWDWQGYSAQSPRFAKLRRDGSIQWSFRGKHGADIIAGVGVEDVRWLLPYLLRITDEELTAGLVASGASAPAAQQFTRAIRRRVQQLEQIAKSTAFQQVASK
jgi:hypothetical protein